MSDNFIYVLGSVQDGGYPHTGCIEKCCLNLKDKKRFISSIAIIDKSNRRSWIIDITPDINSQLRLLSQYIDSFNYPSLSGIFLTHAHIGHYGGLINLGLESMNTSKIPIYAFDKMESFLKDNSIFNQLIKNKNIIINKMDENSEIYINKNVKINGFLVPHRNELSETVGYNIKSQNKSIIYLPDIDSWDKWKIDVIELIKVHDILILDGTFYNKNELKNRNMKKVPHPSIIESMELMNALPLDQRNKVYFTHLNHTNKSLINNSKEYNNVVNSGYNILKDKNIFKL